LVPVFVWVPVFMSSPECLSTIHPSDATTGAGSGSGSGSGAGAGSGAGSGSGSGSGSADADGDADMGAAERAAKARSHGSPADPEGGSKVSWWPVTGHVSCVNINTMLSIPDPTPSHPTRP